MEGLGACEMATRFSGPVPEPHGVGVQRSSEFLSLFGNVKVIEHEVLEGPVAAITGPNLFPCNLMYQDMSLAHNGATARCCMCLGLPISAKMF
jgi:hypothetical protein